MDRKNVETVYIKDEISRCEDLDELKSRILPLLNSQREQWKEKIAEIKENNGYTKTKMAELCGVSRVTIDKWFKGSVPKNRETFLNIGMMANFDVEQMNIFLQRYGRYPALYSKNLDDCICIYVLQHFSGEERISKYQYIKDKIKENLGENDSVEMENLTTEKFDRQLSGVQSEDELENFIIENTAMFSYSYHKFYAYVKMCINANYPKSAGSVYEMAEGQGWSSSLRQAVSAIRQNKWTPTRNKIISLGLHMSMDHDQIDEMLRLAYMEPLCARNIIESVIMFILDDASLNNMLDEDSEDYDQDELCKYAKLVFDELKLPEAEFFISELMEIEDE